jgi:predicted flap endonuclease-1-like 5' DNA nuclease
VKKLARILGVVAGAAAVVWAMRDRLVSITAPREPEPPRFRVVTPPSEPPEERVPASEMPSTPDDLTEVVGIGPVFAERLREAGISTFAQLRATDATRVAEITGASVSRVDGWLIQAEALSTT